jgi:hypothetical protein
MNKEEYLKLVNDKIINKESREIMIDQINNYYDFVGKKVIKNKFSIGDEVTLPKGTLLHGTYKNLEGLREINANGLISSWFIDGTLSKYPSSVGVWNLKHDYTLSDYINYYSGGTILYSGVFENGKDTQRNKTSIVAYDKMNDLIEEVKKIDCHMWTLEQTKEARFMPSLLQDRVQIGIIFNGYSDEIKTLLTGDILTDSIDDERVKEFVNPNYYEKFLKDRKNKDDLFTDRESAVLFGIPSVFIEGILVGREYEYNINILNEIKEINPDWYICNLNGKVIVGNK